MDGRRLAISTLTRTLSRILPVVLVALVLPSLNPAEAKSGNGSVTARRDVGRPVIQVTVRDPDGIANYILSTLNPDGTLKDDGVAKGSGECEQNRVIFTADVEAGERIRVRYYDCQDPKVLDTYEFRAPGDDEVVEGEQVE